MLYKGRQKSHRFTILNDGAFEYDCILNKEPDSNVVSLVLDGTDRFDFYRQPDFVRDPFLKGSYAVYKKETLIGEGTGKLCHIHRPKIIDSRGRWVWGDLSIAGDHLLITIPESWLADAAYPVIVDPTIGTTTIGSQTYGVDPDNAGYDRPMWDSQYALNRFYASEGGGGNATAYVYDCWEDAGAYFMHGVYTDQNTKPYWKISKNEKEILLGYSPFPGWKNNTFQLEGGISAGSYVWFGGSADWFTTRFDYGGVCYKFWLDEDRYYEDGIDDPYTVMPPWIYPDSIGAPFNYIFSWYFTYTASQNYTRTLTQGVTLTDTRKLTAAYKKTITMNGGNTMSLGHGSGYYRAHTAQVKGTDTVPWTRVLFRAISETLKTLNPLGNSRGLVRGLTDTVKPAADNTRNVNNRRDILTTGSSGDAVTRRQGFSRSVLATLKINDTTAPLVSFLRILAERSSSLDSAGHLGNYIRGLFVQAESIAETGHVSAYYRKQEDTAYTEAIPLRSLFMVIRLVTVGFVRDFILKRFLKSNEDIVLKSPVCREIEFDSRIH
ncbi:hypothetical protein AGMMS49928_28810 [Spirochaetia bacterium]|nr:hypothetical protein AGMMS49928_28810 [Spirochaetia bacterium]